MGLRIGDEPVPNYRLVRFLGRGGFGQVWAATSPGGIHVALKIIDLSGREGVKEFKALRLMKSIRQANLTPILAFWLKDEDGQLVDESQVGNDLSSNAQPTNIQGTVLINSLSKMRPDELIIAMGLGDKTLSDRLRECNEQGLAGIPPDELFNYMIDAARAIDFLNTPRHDLGHGPISPIQHCDIKPQNILIVGDTAQVCDFGLARELGTNVKMTSAAVSPAYGAPELIEGRPPSGATDQYSLAITYVELRTGGLPFADPDSYLHVVNAHLYGGLDLNGLTAPEQDVIRKATSREPADRFESALKMVKALRQACPDDGGSLRVMPTQSRHSTGAQVGSDLNVTMPLPGVSTGHSTMPVPLMPQKSSGLTETPGARVHVTKVDSRLQATTTHLEDELAIEGERVRKKRGRIWKTAAALGVLGVVIGAAVYFNRPSDPKDQALIAAQQNIIAGVREPDLKKRAGFFYDAYRDCQKYASDPELRRTMDDAEASLVETWEKVVQKGNGMVLPIADSTPSESSLLDGIEFFDDFLKEFKDAPGVFRVQDARDEIASQAAKRFVEEGEKALKPATIAPADLTAITRKFSKAVDILNEDDELHFRAKLGLARVAALQKRFSIEDAQYLDTKLHELRGRVIDVDPLLEAQIHVLSALAEREKSKDDPGPALQALKKLYPVGIRLLRNPAMGGAELSQVDELLAWAGGLPSRPASEGEIIRDLQSEGIGQAVDEAHSKFQAVVQTKDPAERTAALQSLREAIKRGLASNDQTTKLGYEELRALTDLVDPKAPATDISNAIAWFAAAADGQKLHMSHWSDACIDLTNRDPSQLGPVIEALEKHAGEAHVIATLPKLYQERVIRLVKEPSEIKDYFAVLASASERLRKLGADSRLSNLARAEGLLLNAQKPTSPAQTQAIRDSLATAERQPEVPDQSMYEKYVRLLVRLDSAALEDADRSEIKDVMDAATKETPDFAFAVDARRVELARLAVRAAASLQAGAVGTLDITAIAHPFGKGDKALPNAEVFLEGAKRISPTIEQSAKYKANALLIAWHKGPAERQILNDTHRAEFGEVISDLVIDDHERLPLLYVRVHFPLIIGDPKDQIEAMQAMSTLFDSLTTADVDLDNGDVVELAKRAEEWIKRVKDPRPSDEELRRQVARLAYETERLLLRYKRDGHVARKEERHQAYSLAVSLDDKNVKYLVARGFASLDFDPPRVNEALKDAELLERLAPDSAASQGLTAYAKLEESRRQTDSVRRSKLIEEAVQAGLKAAEAATDPNDQATYLLHLGDSYVALANYGPKDSLIQAGHLRDAIKSVSQAKKLPGLVYEDYANIILGNAYEDLAWWAKVGTEKEINDNYDLAISAFKNVAQTNVALGNMNLGRCLYKREVDSRQVGHGYLTEAKQALELAIERRPDYAEAHRWLGAAHEANKEYDLALKHYDQAVELAEKQGSYNFPYYVRLWARAAANSKQTPGPFRARMLQRLSDPKLKTSEVQKDINLQVGVTYENEKNWSEAIKHYSAAIDKPATQFDVELLRNRSNAYFELAKEKVHKEQPALDEVRAFARDSDNVVALKVNQGTWEDYLRQADANKAYWQFARANPKELPQVALGKSIKAFDDALASFESLTKAGQSSLPAKAQSVFYNYHGLLSDKLFKEDFSKLGAESRKLAKDAPNRLGKAAGKISSTFQGKIMRDYLTPAFRMEIDKL